MTILDELAAYARKRVDIAKEKVSLEEVKQKALAMPKGDFRFEKNLRRDDISFICECKKASPSKGIIAEIERQMREAAGQTKHAVIKKEIKPKKFKVDLSLIADMEDDE